MKKNLFILLVISFSCVFVNAQPKNKITVLYLLPFHLNTNENYSSIKNSTEIHQMKQFEMMGFWLGAKLALQEFEKSDKNINVIVRDVVTDVNALNKILYDSVLMSKVNMIIGPFYGSLFPIAAEYAKQHNIVIVNPFSTRYDFVENNPLVYKLVPPFASRPERIAEVFLSEPNEYEIILWGDSVISPELIAYKFFFSAQNIPYKELHSLSLHGHLKKSAIIIPFFEHPTKVIYAVHSLVNNEPERNIIVVPEKWLSMSELTEDFYNLPHLYFFTNYFVEEECAAVKHFQADHILFYDAPAELVTFSYQGYDITRYFIDLFFTDFDFSKVNFIPLSYDFNWKHIDGGGFENSKTRLIRVLNLGLEEVR